MVANSLSFVVGLSVGKVTTVELRNESYVTGRITEVTFRDLSLMTSRKF